jgi:putative ABC transport system permease protein
VLKGDLSRGTRSSITRKFLVVTQFTIAIVLIIATFVAFRQLNYLRTADIGLKKDNIIMLPVKGTPFVLQYEVFKADLLNNKDIVSVTAVDYMPGVDHNSHEFKPEGYPEDQWQFFPALAIRDDFLKTFDIPIVAGRDYITKSKTDPDQGILINETMVKHLGWKSNEAALGKKFSSLSGHEKVIGVFRDFNAR